MKRVIASTLSVAIVMASALPAAAQAYRYSEAFAPQQNEVSATVNFRVPLGPTQERATVGLTLNGSRADAARELNDGRVYNSEVRIADLRFDGRGVERAMVGGYDFAPSTDVWSYDDSKDPKDGKDGKDPKTMWIIGAIVVGGIIWWAIEEDDDDSSHSPSS